jgi:MFS family permease
MLLFGMWGGVLADRYPKRRVLVLTQLFMGAVALVLGVLDTTGVVALWHVYLLALLLGVGTAVDNPARQAFVSELVGPRDLPNAVGLNSASFNAARIVGPAIAGLLIVLIGTGPVFLVNAVTFGAVVVALYRMRASELTPSPVVPRGKGQLREGLRYVGRRPDLLFVLVVVGFVGMFGLNFQMTMALMATEVYGKGPAEYGILGSIMAVGSLTGALLAARRGRPRLRLVDRRRRDLRVLRDPRRADADVRGVRALARPRRCVRADADHGGELHDAAQRRRRGPRPGHGALHRGVLRRHADRLHPWSAGSLTTSARGGP